MMVVVVDAMGHDLADFLQCPRFGRMLDASLVELCKKRIVGLGSTNFRTWHQIGSLGREINIPVA